MASSPSKVSDAHLEAWLRKHHRLEMIVARPLTLYFDNQASRIAGTIRRAKITSLPEFLIYFDEAKEAERLASLLADDLLSGVAAVGAKPVWDSRPRASKAFRGPRLPKFIRNAINDLMYQVRKKTWWRAITGSTSRQVEKTLKKSIDAGLSFPNMAKAVQKDLQSAIPSRVVALARTETTAAHAAGQHASAIAIAEDNDQFEVQQEWVSLEDKRVRKDHADANGQRIATDSEARFKVGGELARFPGDPLLSARQRVNCRCTTVMVFPDFEE